MLRKRIIFVILCVLAPVLVFGMEDQAVRLRSFLDSYCQTYVSKDIDKFVTFFTSDALENNKPFHELIPKYRSYMEKIQSFNYRVEPLAYSIETKTGNVRVKGKYFTQYLLQGGTWKENSGNFSMELVKSADSYLIKDLNYDYDNGPKINTTAPPEEKKQEMPFSADDYYVALGDSITLGLGEEGSYPRILSDMLTHAKGHPVFVANEGRGGEKSAGGAYRIQRVIDKHPKAQYFLIQYGTNDSLGVIPLTNNVKLMLNMQKEFNRKTKEASPSGLGLNPGDMGYIGSFKYNMQRIIDAILAAGKKPILAKVPIVMEYRSDMNKTPRNLLIQEYNQVIERLVSKNKITVTPPDFYNYFKENKDQFYDRIHPNEKGYQSMATLWFNALQQD
jgi:lysophospholipase L1-like esterase